MLQFSLQRFSSDTVSDSAFHSFGRCQSAEINERSGGKSIKAQSIAKMSNPEKATSSGGKSFGADLSFYFRFMLDWFTQATYNGKHKQLVDFTSAMWLIYKERDVITKSIFDVMCIFDCVIEKKWNCWVLSHLWLLERDTGSDEQKSIYSVELISTSQNSSNGPQEKRRLEANGCDISDKTKK